MPFVSILQTFRILPILPPIDPLMLSAVAARKAALAAQAEQAQDLPKPSVSGSSTPAPSRSARPETPKRKSSTQKSRPITKKTKKSESATKSKEKARASKPVDSFRDQSDIIIVDSDDDEDSDSGMSVLQGFEDLSSVGRSGNGIKASTKRAWSPSQPIEDSSDEEAIPDDADVANPLDISVLFPHLSRPTRAQPIDGSALSTFEPSLDHNMFVLTSDECRVLGLSGKTTIIALDVDDTICVLGTCTLTVLHGSIHLLGATLSSSATKYPMYAPRSSPLPVIQAGEESSSTSLTPETLPPRLRNILQFKAVAALQELKTGVEGLGRITRTFEGVFGPSRWQKSSVEAPSDISGLFMIRNQTKECNAFSLPSTWSAALDALSPNDNMLCGTYIVKGPKNSGKSTFARTLINHLLTTYQRVAFLECDLGQSEFTPGGMVSLNIVSSPILGPPFSHPTLPNLAHFIGSTTPRSSPSHYLDAIHSLIQAYRLDIQTPSTEYDMDNDDESKISDAIPIIVNTMGWSKGLGSDLTQKIESMLEPTDIFDIQAPIREEYSVSVPPMTTSTPAGSHNGGYGAYHDQSTMDATTARIHTLDHVFSPFLSASAYTPADHRGLNILSYFHARFPLSITPPGILDQITAVSWDTSNPLCAVPPYKVDCGIAFDKIVLTGAGSEDVVEEEIGRVLNGAIVGLVRCEPGTMDYDVDIDRDPKEGAINTSKATGIPYTRHLGPPSPLSSTCVGIALIRGVSPPTPADPEAPQSSVKTHIQLLTPLPHALLASSRVLVKGEMELPVWGMLDFRNFDVKEKDKDKDRVVDIGDVAGIERDGVPFLQWGKAPDGVLGAEKRKVRRNLMRRGHM